MTAPRMLWNGEGPWEEREEGGTIEKGRWGSGCCWTRKKKMCVLSV